MFTLSLLGRSVMLRREREELPPFRSASPVVLMGSPAHVYERDQYEGEVCRVLSEVEW